MLGYSIFSLEKVPIPISLSRFCLAIFRMLINSYLVYNLGPNLNSKG
jgi:hypothetical protein